MVEYIINPDWSISTVKGKRANRTARRRLNEGRILAFAHTRAEIEAYRTIVRRFYREVETIERDRERPIRFNLRDFHRDFAAEGGRANTPIGWINDDRNQGRRQPPQPPGGNDRPIQPPGGGSLRDRLRRLLDQLNEDRRRTIKTDGSRELRRTKKERDGREIILIKFYANFLTFVDYDLWRELGYEDLIDAEKLSSDGRHLAAVVRRLTKNVNDDITYDCSGLKGGQLRDQIVRIVKNIAVDVARSSLPDFHSVSLRDLHIIYSINGEEKTIHRSKA